MKNQMIKTAVVGRGLSAKVFHIPYLQVHTGFELVKILDRKGKKSRSKKTEAEIVKDIKQITDDPHIGLVVICTPNQYHFSMAKACLEAGKHVVVEKPFTVRSKEADELIKLANNNKLKIFVYHNRRWDGDFLSIRKIIRNGVIGEVNEYEAHFDRFKPEVNPAVWRETGEPGSGVLYDLGSHLIDQAMVLFGKPVSLEAEITKQRKNSLADDSFVLILNYWNNLKILLKSGMLVEEPGPKYILHGVLGTYIKYGIDPQEENLRKGMMPDNPDIGTENPELWGMVTIDYQDLDVVGNIETEAGCYMEFYNNVYDVIAHGKEMAIRPEEAGDVIRIIELAIESSNVGRPLEVNY
jgi:predicted dehydrogenase